MGKQQTLRKIAVIICGISVLCGLVLLIKNRDSQPPSTPQNSISDLLLLDDRGNSPDLIQDSPYVYRLSEEEKDRAIQILKETISKTACIHLEYYFYGKATDFQCYDADISDVQQLKSSLLDSMQKCGDLHVPPDGVYGANDGFTLTLLPSELRIHVFVNKRQNIDDARIFMTHGFIGRKLEGHFNKEFIETCFSCQTKDGAEIGQIFGRGRSAQ